MKEPEKFLLEIERLAKKWDISAALCIQDRNGLSYEKAFGYADRAEKRALTLGDRYCLSARTSFFMALCLARLAEAGKIRFQDKLDRFMPEYKHAGRITVAHLLRWESGIQDYWSHVRMPALQKDPAHAALTTEERYRREFVLRAEDVSFAQVLDMIGEDDLTHVPGQEDDGSNTTIVFLTELIRRVSGMEPRDYLLSQVFAPLGMTETAPGNSATVTLVGSMKEEILVPLPKLNPSYAFTTTLMDMNKLARALAEKRLFTEKTMGAVLKCKRESSALGFMKMGELYCSDYYPTFLGYLFRLYLNFEDGLSILALNCEEFISRQEEGDWMAFPGELRRAWQDTRVYPQKPELKPVTRKNVWDAMDIRILPEQLAFVPDAKSCIASSLANRQPVYVLMDHGLPVGLAALTINKKKKEYHISFLQVDRRYQNRGYGRIMLTRAMEILKEKGATCLEIGVNRFNIPAQRLYRSVGFQDENVYEEFINLKMTL